MRGGISTERGGFFSGKGGAKDGRKDDVTIRIRLTKRPKKGGGKVLMERRNWYL